MPASSPLSLPTSPAAWLFPSLGLLLLAAVPLSLTQGALEVSTPRLLASTWAWATAQPSPLTGAESLVLSTIRAPRVVLALIVGASLAVCGALLQGLFRNPLASPAVLGVANGAALGAAVAIVLGGTFATASPAVLPVTAFLGATAATAAVLGVSAASGRADTASLLLAGIAISAIAGAGTGLLVYLSDDAQLRTITFFTLGSLGGASWSKLLYGAPLAIVPIIASLWLAGPLNALLLGESEARHLGVPVERIRWTVVTLVCLGVGACVAMSGVISFVGLAVPHLIRLAVGPDHKLVLPASALLGAALLLCADTFARTIVAPSELPIGILTTLLGGPFFLWLLLRDRRGVPS